MKRVSVELLNDTLDVLAKLTGTAQGIVKSFPALAADLNPVVERAEDVANRLMDAKSGLREAINALEARGQ